MEIAVFLKKDHHRRIQVIYEGHVRFTLVILIESVSGLWVIQVVGLWQEVRDAVPWLTTSHTGVDSLMCLQ